MRTITRTTNPNGTYRYEIDGKVAYAASKVLYTHASTYSVNDYAEGMTYPTLFHKTENAANKATGYRNNGWIKTGVQAIEDGDAAATPAPVDEPRKAPRKGTSVLVNDTYPTGTYRGRRGKVESSDTGDDGNLYVMVDFGNDVTWPFLVSELDEDTNPRRCTWCGDELKGRQRKFCSRSCTVRQQNRSRARQR